MLYIKLPTQRFCFFPLETHDTLSVNKSSPHSPGRGTFRGGGGGFSRSRGYLLTGEQGAFLLANRGRALGKPPPFPLALGSFLSFLFSSFYLDAPALSGRTCDLPFSLQLWDLVS